MGFPLMVTFKSTFIESQSIKLLFPARICFAISLQVLHSHFPQSNPGSKNALVLIALINSSILAAFFQSSGPQYPIFISEANSFFSFSSCPPHLLYSDDELNPISLQVVIKHI